MRGAADAHAKASGCTIVLVGHVTKEGALAGPRVLEHIVDTVLYFEGDTHSSFRLVRAIKNRFGAVNEIGVFAMTEKGLKGVSNPSAIFLSTTASRCPAAACWSRWKARGRCWWRSRRWSTAAAPARGACVGLDRDRLAMLLAVLHRHAGVACMDQDVFVNAVGGVRISEPAADLAVLLAIQSSCAAGRCRAASRLRRGRPGRRGAPAPRGQERLRRPPSWASASPSCPRPTRRRSRSRG
jgi:DNA repair protein RadA/Sms